MQCDRGRPRQAQADVGQPQVHCKEQTCKRCLTMFDNHTHRLEKILMIFTIQSKVFCGQASQFHLETPCLNCVFVSLKFESGASTGVFSEYLLYNTSLECLLLSMPIVLISATKYAESGQLSSSLWFMDFHPSYQVLLHVMREVMYIGWSTLAL